MKEINSQEILENYLKDLITQQDLVLSEGVYSNYCIDSNITINCGNSKKGAGTVAKAPYLTSNTGEGGRRAYWAGSSTTCEAPADDDNVRRLCACLDHRPTSNPSSAPTNIPTKLPTIIPSSVPSSLPSSAPTCQPSIFPSSFPTSIPSIVPTNTPTILPTNVPSSPTYISANQRPFRHSD